MSRCPAGPSVKAVLPSAAQRRDRREPRALRGERQRVDGRARRKRLVGLRTVHVLLRERPNIAKHPNFGRLVLLLFGHTPSLLSLEVAGTAGHQAPTCDAAMVWLRLTALPGI